MPNQFTVFTRPLIVRSGVGAFAVAMAAFTSWVNAGSGTGLATATVVGEFVSQPITIRLQAPQPTVQAFPIRLGYTIAQPTSNAGSAPLASSSQGSAASTSFGIMLVEVDAGGVARFSVAGADATSGYTVQFPTSTNSLFNQAPPAAGGSAGSLIVPTQALAGGGQLAVEITQALNKLFTGELSVQVNYN